MKKYLLLPCFALCATITTSTQAEENLAVVGSWSGLPLHKQYEQPFWTEKLAEISGGKMTATLTTHDQMGIKGSDVYRMLSDGVFDIGMTVADYAVADTPALEGLDVPLIANDAATAKKAIDAAKPMIEDIYNTVFNAHVLGIAPYPPQVVFCNGEINGLDDLADKKVRASGRMTALFLEALGAEGVNISFGEVPGALQKGVIDCAVTGAGSGYSAGWWEVSTHLLAIPLGGWDPVVIAINSDKWASLSDEDKQVLSDGVINEIEVPAWNEAQGALENDIACLTGVGECSSGDKHAMTLVDISDSDIEKAKGVLIEKVLPEWAQRSGGDWAARWNDSVGKTVGIEIK